MKSKDEGTFCSDQHDPIKVYIKNLDILITECRTMQELIRSLQAQMDDLEKRID